LVFGIVDKNGAAIALPLRIVHWHNVVETELGGAVVTAVYDEEKKGMMAYESVDNGLNRRFFNSAFLCGGEHLIADEQTHSLWSARSGRPIVYDQTLQGAQLKALPVVATTWAVWVKEHPATKVLPVETGFDRDYRSR
jgi:hypothetical protein